MKQPCRVFSLLNRVASKSTNVRVLYLTFLNCEPPEIVRKSWGIYEFLRWDKVVCNFYVFQKVVFDTPNPKD